PWNDNAAALRARLQLIHRELGAPWPDVSDETLLGTLEGWLAPHVRGASLASIDVTSALRGLLPWPEASRLDTLAPERLEVPS
ncbi:ATP-dependent helicase C-terminal domain-containing protein, partial [Bacillus sp. SIMBA_008]|uniref:ATP-dependent helicase C-terminal domain-containing protein n=1 Tax=Bacillus sp. SIMBA_008 TaxID=3085757 RepID=UPI003979E80B